MILGIYSTYAFHGLGSIDLAVLYSNGNRGTRISCEMITGWDDDINLKQRRRLYLRELFKKVRREKIRPPDKKGGGSARTKKTTLFPQKVIFSNYIGPFWDPQNMFYTWSSVFIAYTGWPIKMHHKDSDLKSVLEVQFYFSTCVLESDFWARNSDSKTQVEK